MPDSRDELPALLGGTPIRPAGPPDWPPDDPAVREALFEVMADRTWGKYQGNHEAILATLLQAAHGLEYVTLCCSGTAAVELALHGVKVEPGDEVILSAYDFKGNFQDVLALGATPVLVDVKPGDWQFDPQHLDAAFSSKTKAVLVSHLHGGVVDMPAVMPWAKARGVAVVEDACQCPGARIHGRVAGAWGDVSVLSFGGSKLLSAGRGGAVMTNDGFVHQRIRLYTQRGNEAYPLSEIQAAILVPQVRSLDSTNARRVTAAKRMIDRLIRTPGALPFQSDAPESTPGYYKLGMQYDPQAFGGLTREHFLTAIAAEGIALHGGFRALHATHSRRRFRSVGELPHATEADRNVLTLHHPILLGSDADLDEVFVAIERIRGAAERIHRAMRR